MTSRYCVSLSVYIELKLEPPETLRSGGVRLFFFSYQIFKKNNLLLPLFVYTMSVTRRHAYKQYNDMPTNSVIPCL
jgi:hypothetical protein